MTLFKQLYAGTLAVLTLTSLLVLLAFNYYLNQDDVNDFLRDVERATADYQAEITAPANHQLRLKLLKAPDCEDFCVSWLGEQDLTGVLSETIKLLQRETTLSVYRYKHPTRLAVVYAHPDLKGYLLVSDLPDNSEHHNGHHSVNEDSSPEYLFPVAFAILAAMGIASVLFFLSHRIERAISQLQMVVSAHDAHPEQRADETSPEPVRQLAQSFNQLADRLDEQHREQQIITHAVAHELRTPLTRMRLALGMIDGSGAKPDTQALLANLDQYVTDMDQLTKEVLLLGRINQAPDNMSPEAVNFSEMIAQRLSQLTEDQHDKIIPSIEADIYIGMSPNHLRLLIDNLLNNALAYAHSQVIVELSQQQNQSGDEHSSRISSIAIVFRVTDDGKKPVVLG